MSTPEQPQLTLRFSPIAAAIAIVFTVVGVCTACLWGEEFFRGVDVGYPRKLKFLLFLLVLIGPGFLIMVQQQIDLFDDRLESRLLGTRRTLDRVTLKVLRNTSNGYVVCDASGRKIHVHRLMVGSEDLRALIDLQGAAGKPTQPADAADRPGG